LTLLLALAAACVVQIALHSVHIWWVLAACQPLLLVMVAASRRHAPTGVAWWGVAAGLASDLLAHRIVGPGAIAGALAGWSVAALIRHFELAGPLFWIVGSLAGTAIFEAVMIGVLLTLDASPDHEWLGALAAVAVTAAVAMAVASGERAVDWWRSPVRARRRALRRL
jgi:rod shape-determining protein MreD